MDKEQWIGKRVWVKPGIMCGVPHLADGFYGTILDIKEAPYTPGLYITKVTIPDDPFPLGYRNLYPSEFRID